MENIDSRISSFGFCYCLLQRVDGQQCSNCSLFQEPNACTLVDGEISPAGWCKFWVKKTG
jgi:High potential iron-sulfur protein